MNNFKIYEAATLLQHHDQQLWTVQIVFMINFRQSCCHLSVLIDNSVVMFEEIVDSSSQNTT